MTRVRWNLCLILPRATYVSVEVLAWISLGVNFIENTIGKVLALVIIAFVAERRRVRTGAAASTLSSTWTLCLTVDLGTGTSLITIRVAVTVSVASKKETSDSKEILPTLP